MNDDTNRFCLLEYQLVAHFWASAQVNDGLYQMMYDLTHQAEGALKLPKAASPPSPASSIPFMALPILGTAARVAAIINHRGLYDYSKHQSRKYVELRLREYGIQLLVSSGAISLKVYDCVTARPMKPSRQVAVQAESGSNPYSLIFSMRTVPDDQVQCLQPLS